MPNNLKGYDAFQVLRSVFDVDKNCLRVCIVDPVSGGPGAGVEVIIDHTEDSIRLGDGTNFITSTTVGPKIGYDSYIINQDLDIRDLDASQDNIAIHDIDGDELSINSDGSITVQNEPSDNITSVEKYGEVTSIASSSETTIITHTAVGGRSTYLQRISTSGENIAEYRVKINGTIIEKKRTYFSGPLNIDFNFDGENNPGRLVAVGDIISVTVIHQRPQVADFNSKIQVIEVI